MPISPPIFGLLRQRAEARLKKLGIEVHLNVEVETANPIQFA
jgi:NADH dehydrogenase FAD-containing subunit